MRKITDGYARQLLRAMEVRIGFGPSIVFTNEMIRVKKSVLHLDRVTRFKRKELNEWNSHKAMTGTQKELARQVYKEASEFYEVKKAARSKPTP